MIRQRLARCHDDGITRMHADRVDVLHVTYGDAVVVTVTHDLVLDFLPAGHAALDEHLADHGVVESLDDDIDELFLILSDAAARAAHGIGRAHDDRIADAVGEVHGIGHALDDGALRDWLAELLHRFLKHLAILSAFNGLERRTEQLDVVFLQHALLRELYGEVQSSLAAQRRKQAVRALLRDNFCHELDLQRLDVDAIRDMRIRHDRGRVRVHEHDLEAFLFQGAAGLRARVVELRGLANNDRAGANDHDFFEIFLLWHGLFPFLQHSPELVEQIHVVVWSWGCLRMILHGENRQLRMAHALHRAIVDIDVRNLERQAFQ